MKKNRRRRHELRGRTQASATSTSCVTSMQSKLYDALNDQNDSSLLSKFGAITEPRENQPLTTTRLERNATMEWLPRDK